MDRNRELLREEIKITKKHLKKPSSLAIRVLQIKTTFISYQSEQPRIRKQLITNIGKDVGEEEPLYTLGGLQTGAGTLETSVQNSQNTKKQYSI